MFTQLDRSTWGGMLLACTASFAGTVNNPTFLADATGNRRYWPLEVISLDTNINTDGVWAQAWHMYSRGVQRWPSDEQEAVLEMNRSGFEEAWDSPIIQTVLARYVSFDPDWKELMGTRSGPIARSERTIKL